jgi:hypothetical protein
VIEYVLSIIWAKAISRQPGPCPGSQGSQAQTPGQKNVCNPRGPKLYLCLGTKVASHTKF